MEPEAREQRFVFGEVAELYDRARAGYPAELVDDVLSFVGRDADRLRVLEVGAGTGKATVAFAARGLEILALEPDPAMGAVALRNCQRFPGVRIVRSTFEDWPVEEGRFDLLLAAQSWHWVDPEVRWVKAAQVLQAGATLALMGHHVHWQGEPLRDELEDVYSRVAPELLARHPGFPGLHPDSGDAEVAVDIAQPGRFRDATVRTYPWSEHLTSGGFLERLATQSNHRLLPAAERDDLFEAVRDVIVAHGGAVTIPGITVLTLARLAA